MPLTMSAMPTPEEIAADQLAFWDGAGGHLWVARQAHTDITVAPMTEALLTAAAPRSGERVLDIGCGCGATTLRFARAVGASGQVVAMDISGPMLAEGQARAKAAALDNIDWHKADASVAALRDFDLLASAFGVMFFGDPVAAFANLRRAAKPSARMVLVCWRPLAENPWMRVPMDAVAAHLPPRPAPVANAPGMFSFADPDRVTEILTSAGWSKPRIDKLDLEFDIAAGRGLEAAVVQSTQIGAVNSWLRGQPQALIDAAVASVRQALSPHADGETVRLPAAMWMISSQPA